MCICLTILISILCKLQEAIPLFLTCFCKWNCLRPLNFAFLELSRGLFHLGLFFWWSSLSCVNMYANQIPVVTEWCQKHCHHLQHIWHISTTHFYIRRWWWKSERSTPYLLVADPSSFSSSLWYYIQCPKKKNVLFEGSSIFQKDQLQD